MTTADLIARLHAWWTGGDLLMPMILLVGLALYGLLGATARRLWCAAGCCDDELRRTLLAQPQGHARHDAFREIELAEQAVIAGSLRLVRTLTTALPLLGLLGTVAGMVHTFGDLAAGGGAGSGDGAQRASAGIGLALTATQYGLALAVPALLIEAVLRQRARARADQRRAVWSELASDLPGSPASRRLDLPGTPASRRLESPSNRDDALESPASLRPGSQAVPC